MTLTEKFNTTNNTPQKYYLAVHYWLRSTFGVADCCENEYCLGESIRFQYALKRGCIYKKDRSNFLMFCVKCHMAYDGYGMGKELSLETRQKIGDAHRGRIHTKQSRNNMSKAQRGKIGPFTGMSHSKETKQRISNTKKGKPWTEARRMAQEKHNG